MKMKQFKCQLCQEEHDIDKYGWIQCNTLGYIELGNYIYEMEEWLNEQRKKYVQKKVSRSQGRKG